MRRLSIKSLSHAMGLLSKPFLDEKGAEITNPAKLIGRRIAAEAALKGEKVTRWKFKRRKKS